VRGHVPLRVGVRLAARWSCQLEELIVAAVLYRLDTPQLADILAGRNAQDEQTAALSDTLAQDEAQLTELAEMYANREIGRSEWVTARGLIEPRVNDLRRRLARMTRNDALSGVVGNGANLKAQWPTLNLTRQHAIVSHRQPSSAILDHAVIAPAPTAHVKSTPPESTSTGDTEPDQIARSELSELLQLVVPSAAQAPDRPRSRCFRLTTQEPKQKRRANVRHAVLGSLVMLPIEVAAQPLEMRAAWMTSAS